jgi:hypothetical protein
MATFVPVDNSVDPALGSSTFDVVDVGVGEVDGNVIGGGAIEGKLVFCITMADALIQASMPEK